MENEWQPMVQASQRVKQLPIETELYVSGILNKYVIKNPLKHQFVRVENRDWVNFTLNDWRKIENMLLRQWLRYNHKDYFKKELIF